MKKRKVSYLLGSIGLVGFVVIPMTVAASCGKKSSGGRYDVEDDNQIIIEHTFSSNGPHKGTLEAIAATYNKTQKGKPDFVPVKAVKIEGGYGDSVRRLEKKFQTRDKKSTPNMIIDYPDSAAILRQYRMELNVQEAVNKDHWIPSFLEINDKIGGISKGGIYSVPISLSSEMLSIDSPLFAYVVDVWNTKFPNNQIDVTSGANPKIQAIYDKGKASTGDIDKIKGTNLWGEGIEDVSNIKVETPTDKILTHYDKLIAFANTVQQMFGIKADAKENMHIFGDDSPVNLLQELVFLYGGADLKNFLYTIDAKGTVNMDFLKSKASAGYTNFQKAYNLLQPAIASGAVWLGGGGAYGSSFLTQHKMLFDLGSTSGYRHNYAGNDSLIGDDVTFDDKTSYTNINKGQVKTLLWDSSKGVPAIKGGKYTNAIVPSDQTAPKYGYSFVNGVSLSTEDEVNNFFGGNTNVVIFTKKDETEIDTYITDHPDFNKIKKLAHDESGNPVYVIAPGLVKVLTTDETLQEGELTAEIMPRHLEGTEKGVIFQQGPSIIPVHANPHEDKGTIAFLKWFESSDKYTFENYYRGKNIEDATPRFAWMEGAQYIAPVKGAFDDGGELKQFLDSKQDDPYVKAAIYAYKAFKFAYDNKDTIEILNPPVDPYTSKLRNEVMGSLLRSQVTNAHAGHTVQDFNGLYKKVITLSKTNGII